MFRACEGFPTKIGCDHEQTAAEKHNRRGFRHSADVIDPELSYDRRAAQAACAGCINKPHFPNEECVPRKLVLRQGSG